MDSEPKLYQHVGKLMSSTLDGQSYPQQMCLRQSCRETWLIRVGSFVTFGPCSLYSSLFRNLQTIIPPDWTLPFYPGNKTA